MRTQTLVDFILDRLPASNSAMTITIFENKGVVCPKLNSGSTHSE